ncbi:MAG: hypothetical protein J6Y03_00750 [Alphaproteobacteria bacterium]|nr:hypothetical protein [Alphaproteobacteria bacterium]
MKSLKNTLNKYLAGVALLSAGMMASAEDDSSQTTEKTQIEVMDMSKIQKKKNSADTICRSLAKMKLVKHEGCIDHFYFDTRGLLTTGVGLNVDSWDNFNKLDIMDLEGNILTEEQKKEAYEKIMATKANYAGKFAKTTADKYKDAFGVMPTPASSGEMFNNMVEVAQNLSLYYCGFNFYNLHPRVQSEIVCYCYSLSPTVLNQFKKFFGALDELDYETAAKESNVIGWGQTRKNDVLAEFNLVPKNFSMKLGDAMENAFVDEVLADFPETSNTIRRGVWEGKQCIVVGPGIPVTLKDIQKLRLFDECGEKNADTLYKAVFNKREVKELSEEAIRKCVKHYYKENRKTRYNSLCKDINSKSIIEQAAILRLACGTAGREKSYKGFGREINKGNLTEAAKEIFVSESVFARNHPSSDPEVLKANCKKFNDYSYNMLANMEKPQMFEVSQAVAAALFRGSSK